MNEKNVIEYIKKQIDFQQKMIEERQEKKRMLEELLE